MVSFSRVLDWGGAVACWCCVGTLTSKTGKRRTVEVAVRDRGDIESDGSAVGRKRPGLPGL